MPASRLGGARPARANGIDVDCQICGQTALPGAKLCAACRKALKRARHDTVSVVEPLRARATQTLERRKAKRAAAAQAAGTAPSVIPPPLPAAETRSSLLFAVLSVVACGVAWLAFQHWSAAAHGDAPTARANSTSPAAAPVPVATISKVTSTEVSTKPPVVPVAPDAASVAPPVVAPVPRARPAPTPVVVPPPVVRTEPPPVVPAAVVEAPPPPVVREVRPPDRGQLLASAFARCQGDGLLATALCEQRARIEYCDGYWGTLPQCPAGRADTYGN